MFLDVPRWHVSPLLQLLRSCLVLCGFLPFVWYVLRGVLRLLLVFVSSVLVGPGAAVPSVASCLFPCMWSGYLVCFGAASVGWGFVCLCA